MEFNKKCFVVLLIFARRWNRINFATLKSYKKMSIYPPIQMSNSCKVSHIKTFRDEGRSHLEPSLNVPNFVLLHTITMITWPLKGKY